MIAIAETKVIASAIPTVNQRSAPFVRKDSATTQRRKDQTAQHIDRNSLFGAFCGIKIGGQNRVHRRKQECPAILRNRRDCQFRSCSVRAEHLADRLIQQHNCRIDNGAFDKADDHAPTLEYV